MGVSGAPGERCCRDAVIEAVLFDFSGVLTTSPWAGIAATAGGDLEMVVGPYHEDTDHPWHRLERGEITIEEWLPATVALFEAAGREFDLPPLYELFATLKVHDDVVVRIGVLQEEGYKTELHHQQRSRRARMPGAR